MQAPESKEKTATEYTLTDPERAGLSALQTQLVLRKAALYDAQAALREAEQLWQGALNMLATAHEMGGAQITPDMSKLVRR